MKKIKYILIVILIMEIAYFFYNETNNIVINTQEIQDEELAKVLGDLRVVQLSDLHIMKFGVREKRLINLIDKIDPDIIFITGDFISGNKGIASCIEVLKDLVRGRNVIVTLGNNDHSFKDKYINTELLVKEMKAIGIKVLINESIKLLVTPENIEKESKYTGGSVPSEVYVVGLDDNYLWLDDIFKAMNNVPENSPKILLAHAPNIIEKINTKGINLILSGHTHGGQIVFPIIGALYTNPVCNTKKKFVSGLYNEDTKLYVSRGIGTVMINLRLFCPPEITVFKFSS